MLFHISNLSNKRVGQVQILFSQHKVKKSHCYTNTDLLGLAFLGKDEIPDERVGDSGRETNDHRALGHHPELHQEDGRRHVAAPFVAVRTVAQRTQQTSDA
jgi:hypothetical protein